MIIVSQTDHFHGHQSGKNQSFQLVPSEPLPLLLPVLVPDGLFGSKPGMSLPEPVFFLNGSLGPSSSGSALAGLFIGVFGDGSLPDAAAAAAAADAPADPIVAFWPLEVFFMLSPAEARSFMPVAWNTGLNRISNPGKAKRNASARQAHDHLWNLILRRYLRLSVITQSPYYL
ncbi:hypothetical protein RCIX2487 [Methanocella arvoryzae MRE50]|uniref:Uncharacterized protein n=1 Tax=Methanocella arvoryzae (strain DSM 22066 / NBRC 105507 / MRE50) TaxID=351160 RepID=Q0W233_METAR|nr:hypothetical protein RCIX2487 [Methanocella arvoryzae MRE50]